MPAFGPIKRRELVACLRRLGYSGPYAGGRHEFVLRGGISVTIPNPHGSDIGPNLLSKVLRQAQVSPETNGKHFKVAWAGCGPSWFQFSAECSPPVPARKAMFIRSGSSGIGCAQFQ